MSAMPDGNNGSINSAEKSSHRILFVFGIVFLIISVPIIFSIPAAIVRGKLEILFALIFPLAGLGLCLGGWRMRKKFMSLGLSPLTPSPPVGQIGGQVGGHIALRQPWAKRTLSVYLSCIHTYSTGSGKNSTTSKDIIWQEESYPVDKAHHSGSKLEFCFNVPADLPIDGKYRGKGHIHWEVMLEGAINQLDFKRHWIIPVEAGTALSNIIISDRHKEATTNAMRKQAEISVGQQIQSETTADGLSIVSEQGRNKSMSYSAALFGLIFTSVGVFLFIDALQGDILIWFMAPVFFILGLGVLTFGVFLMGRKLECKITGDTVYIRRSLFSKILYIREGRLISASQLKLKSTMSSQEGSKKTEYMALYANVSCTDGKSRELKLVEGIEGRRAGEAMKNKVAVVLLANE